MTSHTRESVAEDLRIARAASGLTQTEAGSHVGLSRAQIANLETGRNETSASNYLNLMDLYGVGVPSPQRDEMVQELRKMRGLMKAAGDFMHWFAENPYLRNGD